ncbi:MAG: two pore domain potassium channel family protein [Patulibacter sp.]|nr:two pore domain potassium channel family protein [Patulibacter sp.]
MSAVEWLSTGVGIVLVVGGLRELFHTLLQPAGIGELTTWLFRGVWRLTRRSRRARGVAGPLGMVGSVGLWVLLLTVGWGLVYWPHLPEHFQISAGIPADAQSGVPDAIYVSAVALSTLGFGDVVAETTPLRFALVLEAVTGFALLTSGITWVLSIYPALLRRRALAGYISTLVDDDGGLLRAGGSSAYASALYGLADDIGKAQVDLMQYPSSYFFSAPSKQLSLAAALPRLRRMVARDDLPAEITGAAEAVRTSLQQLGGTLRDGPFGLRVDDPDDALVRYGEDHRD